MNKYLFKNHWLWKICTLLFTIIFLINIYSIFILDFPNIFVLLMFSPIIIISLLGINYFSKMKNRVYININNKYIQIYRGMIRKPLSLNFTSISAIEDGDKNIFLFYDNNKKIKIYSYLLNNSTEFKKNLYTKLNK